MAEVKEIFERLRGALRKGDEVTAKRCGEDILKARIDPLEVIRTASDEMKKIGDEFESGKLYLPHVMMAANAMKYMVDALLPAMTEEAKGAYLGKVVIGTVEGDVHEIGKEIVAVMLHANGFQVFNLGKDVPIQDFVKKAKEVEADIIGASALMTSTMPNQKILAEELKKAGIRDKVKYMIGGAPVTDAWAEKIGADARGEDAADAVRKAKKLMRLGGS